MGILKYYEEWESRTWLIPHILAVNINETGAVFIDINLYLLKAVWMFQLHWDFELTVSFTVDWRRPHRECGFWLVLGMFSLVLRFAEKRSDDFIVHTPAEE